MSQVWLVTGSSRGLGRALAEAVLEAGHRLVATSRKVEDVAALTTKYGDHVRAVALDVTDPAAAERAVALATSAFGRLDVVVNNAGYANISSIEDVPIDDFRAQIETNFFGAVHVTRAALPVLRTQRSGHFIQVSSIGGRGGNAGLAAYQSAKFALEGFSEVLAREVQSLGLHVTLVEPGGFRTDWAGSSMRVDQIREEYKQSIAGIDRSDPTLLRGDPAKAASAIVRIAGEAKPPLRLLLGTDALFLAELYQDRQRAEDAKWRHVGASTDFDGTTPFADTAIAKYLSTPRD